VVANVARYHRRAVPREARGIRHPLTKYKRIVRILAALLRIATAWTDAFLGRPYLNVKLGATSRSRAREGDAELETWAAAAGQISLNAYSAAG